MTGFMRTLGIAAAVFAAVSAMGAGRGWTDVPADDAIWRVKQRCPINTLYVVLRLYGKDVSYQEVLEQLPVGREGSSLTDMRDFAARHGLPARVQKLTPEKLAQVRFPVIAHLEEENTSGHFVVLLQLGKNSEGFPALEYIDGTTGMTGLMDALAFRRQWTGFVLSFGEEPRGVGWLLPAAVVLGGLLVALTLIRVRLDRAGMGRKQGRLPGLATTISQ
jgi:hypothetical protein